MPLVFVHGVNTRFEPGYRDTVKARDALFKRLALDAIADPDHLTIVNPYWGDFAARFAWNHASLPGSDVERMGPADISAFLLSQSYDEQPDRDTAILTVARRSLTEAIDLLWAAGLAPVADEQVADELA